MSLLDLIRSLIVRGSVTGADASQQTQALSVAMMLDEDEDGVENFAEPYGLANSLPAGTECIIVSVGGAADHQVVVGTADKANRPDDLEDGEVAVYSKHGQKIVLKTDGSIVAVPKDGKTFDIGETATKAIALAEDVDARLTTLQAAHDSHIHVTTATIDAGLPGVLAVTVAPVGALAPTGATKGRAE